MSATMNPPSLDHIQYFQISESCAQSYPCQHEARALLTDGKAAYLYDAQEIAVLIQALPPEKIIYGEVVGRKDAAWKHFRTYTQLAPSVPLRDRNEFESDEKYMIYCFLNTPLGYTSLVSIEEVLKTLGDKAIVEETPFVSRDQRMIELFKREEQAMLDRKRRLQDEKNS